MDAKTKTTVGWVLIGLGALFLIAGLVVLVAITMTANSGSMADPLPPTSIWTAIMDFVIRLINVEWNPSRVGVFLVLVGMALEGGGIYVMIADPGKKKSN